MTTKLFLEDPYIQNFEAKVTAVAGQSIQLDRTAFYATSGGQPGDTGKLKFVNQNIPVIAVKKGEAPDDVWHQLPEDAVIPPVGYIVSGGG